MSDAPPAKRLRESEGAGGSRAPATAGAAAPANLAINYFPRDSMFTSADAQLIASDGTKLAVHSQLLINVSRVLEEAFAVGAEVRHLGGTRHAGHVAVTVCWRL